MSGYSGQQQAHYGNIQTEVIPQQSYYSNTQQRQPSKPALPRSISTTNLETTRQCRALIQQDWVSRAPAGGTNFFQSTPCFTFSIPSLSDYSPDFRQFVFDRLIDKETQRFLEGEHCLNWCQSTNTLYPLFTMGDGNCLLHAASLGMWGFQDRDYVLRRAVYQALMNHHGSTLNQRWRHSRHLENQKQGMQLEAHQWDQEWQLTVHMASLEVPPGKNMESLEEFHVFVLANVLRRPIIMYAGPKIRSAVTDTTLQHLNFHGIYLPLLWDPKSCKKDPLPLAYYAGHFSALAVVDSSLTHQGGRPHLTLPLSDYYGQILPVRYALPVEDPMSLIMDYLDLIQIATSNTSPYVTTPNIICAKLSIPEVPKYLKPLLSGFIDACWAAHTPQPGGPPANQGANGYQPMSPQGAGLGATSNSPQKCNICHVHYGSPDRLGMCSECHRKAMQTAHDTERGQGHTLSGQGAPGQGVPGQGVPGQGAIPESQKCVNGCDLYGRADQLGMCSSCYRKAHEAAQAQESAKVDSYQQPPQQGSLSSGAIKCPHCTNPGLPMFLGMCEACYQRTTVKVTSAQASGGTHESPPRHKGPIYESLKSVSSGGQSEQPPALPPPRGAMENNTERSKCRMPGCEFFGTKETRFYCSKCFDKNMDQILKEVDSNPRPVSQYQPPPADTGGFVQQPTNLPPPSYPGANETQGNKPKCRKCNRFYGDEELGGMCHNCFMEMTKHESQNPPNQTDILYNPQPSRVPHQITAPQLGYCSTPGCQRQAAQGSSLCHSCMSRDLPDPAPSFYPPTQFREPPPNFNTPTQFPNQASPPAQQRPVPKPRTNIPGRGITTAPVTTTPPRRGSSQCFICNGESSFGGINEVCDIHKKMIMTQVFTSPPAAQAPPTQEEVRRKSTPYDQQHVEDSVRSKNIGYQSPSSQYTPVRGSQEFGVPLPLPNQQQPQRDPQHGAGYPPQRDPQHGAAYQPQRDPQHGAVYNPPVSSYSYQAPSNQPGYQQNQLSSYKPPVTSSSGAYSGYPQDKLPPPFIDRNQGYGGNTMGGASGGAMGGATFGASGGAMGGTSGTMSSDQLPVVKTLCATPGCSFKGYADLSNLCPDCYEEQHQTKVSQEKYPLV